MKHVQNEKVQLPNLYYKVSISIQSNKKIDIEQGMNRHHRGWTTLRKQKLEKVNPSIS